MERFTQKQLRSLVATGAATDVTNATDRKVIPENYRQVGYSAGVYGCNGMLLKGDSGRLYAVTQRTTAIFLF